MLLLYEGGVSPVQLRVILLLWANSFVKACSVEANPIETIVVMSISLWSLFDSMDGEMQENTKVRAQEIVSSFELPISSEVKGQKLKFKSFHYVPNLLTSLLSTIFMVYLLSRRHQLTPDIIHFVTCIQEDLQHMLWLFIVWICFR